MAKLPLVCRTTIYTSDQHFHCTVLQATQNRLDALENDNPDDAPDPFGLAVDEDDDEFMMAESEDEG